MPRSRSLNSILVLSVLVLAAMSAFACSSYRGHADDGAVWFVHASDPHIYLHTQEGASDAEKNSISVQESQDQDVLSAFLQRVRTLPQAAGQPAFILITGDFGVDPCLIPNADTLKKPEKTRSLDDCVTKFDPKKRDERVAEFAKLFSASPVRNIYILAGNNDLPWETADDAGIAYFNQFFQDVQNKITNADVRLHNLTGCYGSKAGMISDCFPDIPGTAYRMIGFPSFSYKNKEPGSDKNPPLQTAQFKTFRELLDQATKDGKKVIIATHTPEIDDPFFLAQDRYAGVKPAASIDTDKDNPRSPYSTWNVQKALLDEWTKVLCSDTVVAVLAGHLHDNHKEIYQQPYSWSTLKEHQLGYRKLFLAPPLSVKNQDGSPIQARGFSVVFLKHDHLKNRFYWFDGKTSSFILDASFEFGHPGEGHRSLLARLWHWATGLFYWFWRLGDIVLPLEHTATLLIALLTAFLTVVALWQIPPSDDPLTKKSDASAPPPAPASSPFTTNFGRTILAGLGGLVVTEVTKTLGNQNPSAETKWYYIDCFIFFFFVMLFGLNFVRAFVEALRSRVAVIHYSPPRLRGQDWIRYLWSRVAAWFQSLRVPFLTFFDTFINLIQGNNQTKTTTQVIGNALIEQQLNIILAARAIRKNLTKHLRDRAIAGGDPNPNIRVNISVLSADQSRVFYISRSAGSAFASFPMNSMAWVSVFTGKIRWYESFYKGLDIVLFDNTDQTIAGAPNQLKLADYYQQRHDDYQAFIIVPVPRPQRGDSDYVKGAIHISFGANEDFSKIWSDPAVNLVPSPPPAPLLYPEPEHMLDDWCSDVEVKTALNDAVTVLGELLRGFKETVFNQIPPDKRD